jgi:hypothetical protein
MTVNSGQSTEINVRHSGPQNLAGEVLDASYRVIEQAPTAIKQIEDWSQHTLTRPQQLAYAEAALELIDHTLKPSPEQLIAPRRHEDNKPDIWTTLNIVQENLMKGGQQTRNADGRRRHVWSRTKTTSGMGDPFRQRGNPIKSRVVAVDRSPRGPIALTTNQQSPGGGQAARNQLTRQPKEIGP